MNRAAAAAGGEGYLGRGAMGFLGRGLRRDWARRSREYAGDWTPPSGRGLARVMAASAYIFCASGIPAVAFGSQLWHATQGELGIVETLAATGIAGVLQAFFGGQPLLIIGVAEPIVIIYAFMFQAAQKVGVPFLPWAACACCWASAILLVMCLANICDLLRLHTRFCGELFGMLIATLFMQQAFVGTLGEFAGDGFGSASENPEARAWRLFGGAYSAILCLVFVFACMVLSSARDWPFLVGKVRSLVADYAAPVCLVAFTAISLLVDQHATLPDSVPRRVEMDLLHQSTWINEGLFTLRRMGEVPAQYAALAAVPGLVIAVLFYFDHSVSSQLAQSRDLGVKKPSAFHWDLLWISIVTLVFGLIGLPPVNGVIPQAPMHTRALMMGASGDKAVDAEAGARPGGPSPLDKEQAQAKGGGEECDTVPPEVGAFLTKARSFRGRSFNRRSVIADANPEFLDNTIETVHEENDASTALARNSPVRKRGRSFVLAIPQDAKRTSFVAESQGRGQGRASIIVAPAAPPAVRVYEQRWSNLLQACLTFSLLFAAPLLRKVPTVLLWGFFAVMSLQSLPGSQFWDRLKFMVTDPRKRQEVLDEEDNEYLRECPVPTIVLFTALQTALLAIIWGVTVFAGIAGICFPVLIEALVPLRMWAFPRLFSAAHLEALDSLEAEPEAPAGAPPAPGGPLRPLLE